MHEHVYVYRYIYMCILIYTYKWILQHVCVNEYVNMLVLGHGNVCDLFCEWMWLCLCVIKCVFTCVEVIMCVYVQLWVNICISVCERLCEWIWIWSCLNVNVLSCPGLSMSDFAVSVLIHMCVFMSMQALWISELVHVCEIDHTWVIRVLACCLLNKCESMCMYECVWEVGGSGCKCTTLSVYKSIRICVFLWEFKWECRLVMEVTYKHALCVWECSRLHMFMYEWTSEYAHECEHEHM